MWKASYFPTGGLRRLQWEVLDDIGQRRAIIYDDPELSHMVAWVGNNRPLVREIMAKGHNCVRKAAKVR